MVTPRRLRPNPRIAYRERWGLPRRTNVSDRACWQGTAWDDPPIGYDEPGVNWWD